MIVVDSRLVSFPEEERKLVIGKTLITLKKSVRKTKQPICMGSKVKLMHRYRLRLRIRLSLTLRFRYRLSYRLGLKPRPTVH